jgi:hypothetical protein
LATAPEVSDATDGLQQAVDDKQADDDDDTVPTHQRKKKKQRDESLPENLPRIEVTVDVPDGDKVCDAHGEKTLIGYDTTETLIYSPPKLEIKVTKWAKYACPSQPQCGVTQVERPDRLIEGNRDDSSTHAACNAHGRRKIFEARHNHPQVAAVLLARYQELYDVEDLACGVDIPGRLELRQQKAAVIWQRMGEYLNSDVVRNMLPKESMTEAIAYVNNHWDALQVYVSNADVPIDNNETEQLMKHVATGRKNWLFIGSLAAGERTADLLTLVSSALRNDLHVFSYVKGLLDALLTGTTDYESLRPDVWAQQHPNDVRTYRKEERRDKADRKQRRRATRRAARS